MRKFILRFLGMDYLEERLFRLEEKFNKLEEGVMHDDYPKCIPPEFEIGMSICKHGRTIIKGKL